MAVIGRFAHQCVQTVVGKDALASCRCNLNEMLAFVTGATGFVGSHVAQALAEQGADLRLLVRPNSNKKNIKDLKADLVVGDLRDPASLAKAIAGCEVVFHVAAD